ncbi:ligand-binding sensor domain-containing diguanylate cyclase [Mesoterricola silvestris]|uniref:diguanylate cyclase n=1 Tax=Mesoterricola silvestris TaxID=2927979 RepID=A0AA48GX55_9BACT|nr:ligand-binding sensor domain-containing diguanylate cyclase [Mesoterricola silvestris]BDU73501.1 GGDEF domain-containing protein [Mesoterricola silvestris]
MPLLGAPAASRRVPPGVFSFQSFGVEEGLTNLGVYGFAQDAEGYLWAGTEDGLYRYDGHRFQLWGQSLKSSVIWEIAASPTGGLWVGTDDGIFRLEGRELRPEEGLPRQRAAFLALGPDGKALAAQGNVLYGRDAKGPMEPVRNFPEPILAGWASRDLKSLLLMTETRLWRRLKGQWTALELPPTFHGTGGKLLQDRSGRIFLRDRKSLWRGDAWGAPWVDLSTNLPSNAYNTYAPAEDSAGRIWVGTSKGLVCFDGDSAWTLGESKGLPGGWASLAFLDREGNLWVTSEGIHKLKGRSLWTNFGPHQGLPSPSVWDIGHSVDGRVFACTDSGVAVLKGETWTVLPGTEGRTLLSGGGNGRDALWFGGSGKNEAFNTVFRLDLKTNRVEKISIKPCKTSNLILTITSAPEGGAYLGSRTDGVFQVSREKGGWKTEPLPFPNRQAEERVNALRKAQDGGLWAAGEHGLFFLENRTWTRVGREQGLLGTNCASLARDPRGHMWVSYLDAKGISRLDRVNGAWRVVESRTQPEALFKDSILSMGFDPKGVLWLGTSGGMKRWDGKALDVFNKSDGLISQDPMANGLAIEPDGGLWQGFANGISYFQPRTYQGPPPPPVAKIQDITDLQGEHPVDEVNPRIPYAARTLSFHFSGLSFLNESRMVHEVRLVGLENEWRETRVYEARYPALPAGSYRFEVRSRFAEGQPGPVAGFSFQILPPWWGTWWFRTLSALAAGGLVLLGFRRRTAHLHRRNAALEAMVATRTRALESSKRDLEKANLALEEASLVDPLTGLHNRRFLDLSLPSDALQAQRAFREHLDAGADPLLHKEDILLFLLDIDHFKTVNDTHGHLAGDQVLKQLSGILRANTRATDSLVRWGGEEFLLVARRTRRAGASAIANGLLEAIRAYTFVLSGGVEFQKTWSIGFTPLPVHPRFPEMADWQQALKLADQCLYAAKNTGRDRWVGALMPPEADAAPLEGMKTWDLDWAASKGLMDITSSEPGFRWPE